MTQTAILVSADDAAVLLSTTRWRILRLVRDGRLPFIDLGDGEPRFTLDELRAWVQGIGKATSQGKEGAVLLGDGRHDGRHKGHGAEG